MAWPYRTLFLGAAALFIWGGFIKKGNPYLSRKIPWETKTLMWFGRVVTGLLAAFFIWWALAK